MREKVRPVVEIGPQLTQDRNQARATKSVDLVEEKHQRPGGARGPGFEERAEQQEAIDVGELAQRRRLKLRRQMTGRGKERLYHHFDGLFGVLATGLRRLTAGQEGGVAAFGRQAAGQSAETGRFAALARRVHDEITRLVDELSDLAEPRLGRQHVVAPRIARARGVEGFFAHGGNLPEQPDIGATASVSDAHARRRQAFVWAVGATFVGFEG